MPFLYANALGWQGWLVKLSLIDGSIASLFLLYAYSPSSELRKKGLLTTHVTFLSPVFSS